MVEREGATSMRKIIGHMQTTLDGRIARGDGTLWEPFPWGDAEVAYVNETFRRADTWAMSRVLYEAIIPYWHDVATGHPPADAPPTTPAFADFAKIQEAMTKVVFSRTAESGGDVALSGDLAPQLFALKEQEGRDIILSAGPRTLGPLASTPGLVDEYVLPVSPIVLSSGPRLFEDVTTDLVLNLVHAETFAGGAVVLHYQTVA
jgi:dihydrofolate reductase